MSNADPIRPWAAKNWPRETYCEYLNRKSDPVRQWLRAEAAHGTYLENLAEEAEAAAA